jgi:hypothetical protein
MKRTFASHKKPQALSGLAVDTHERANVQRFYQDPYAALSALSNQMAWTGDWDTCQPGRFRCRCQQRVQHDTDMGLRASLSELRYHLIDGGDRSPGLIDHDAVTALVCKELLAVRR